MTRHAAGALALTLVMVAASVAQGELDGRKIMKREGRKNGGTAVSLMTTPPHTHPNPTASPDCVRLANTIASGGCKDWHAAAARVGASIVAADCGTMHAVALTLPTPDDACCGQLREFVEAGCGCDADVARLAALGGFGADTPRGGARLATVTRCADPAAGGRQMANKCGGNCVPVLAGQQAGGGGAGAAAAPGGLPTAALGASNSAIAQPAQPVAATTSGTASAPAPPGAKPAPSVNVPRARSPSPAPPSGGGSGGDAMMLTDSTRAVPVSGVSAAPRAGAAPVAGAAPGGGASAAPGGGTTPAAGGAVSSTAPGSLPNINTMMGVVGPGILNMPVTPGR